MTLLTLSHLSATVEGQVVLADLSLSIREKEIHAIMGPNGSGKTSLARVVMGDPRYEVVQPQPTTVIFDSVDLLTLSPDERARHGLFVVWQNPMTIPGLTVFALCKAAYEAHGKQIASVVDFKRQLEELLVRVGLTKDHLSRGVNEGFSGGEKKRLELAQLLLLNPKLVILDEIDSGLDVDALRLVGEVVAELTSAGTSFVLITHYKRLLEYVTPHHVHVLKKGTLVRSGGHALVEEIERTGYAHI